MDFTPQVIQVSELVGLINQTFDYNFGKVLVEGELANFKISKNQWVYFDLKDDNSTVRFFGTVRQLNFPVEDGMLLRVFCYPHLHQTYGMSMQVEAVELVGEGSIKRATMLLKAKLEKEGLFDVNRKRQIPYPPKRIGLISSTQSAAYHDFIKVLGNRYKGIEIDVIDVQVQGYLAVSQIVAAIKKFNSNISDKLDCLVLIRGGGSPEDLAAFNEEILVRAVADSKIPTVVAIGHEIDVSLAELVADLRGSTPSNAAELMVPESKVLLENLKNSKQNLLHLIVNDLEKKKDYIAESKIEINNLLKEQFSRMKNDLDSKNDLLKAYNPTNILKRGFALVTSEGKLVKNSDDLEKDDVLKIKFYKGKVITRVMEVEE